jgi:hypothetical protein
MVLHPLHLDLYNPIAAGNKQQLQKLEPKVPSSSIADIKKDTAHLYPLQQHQRKSSTASLAEFLKTTGPTELRQGAMTETARPLSPPGNRKKNPGSFLLKFSVGKSTTTQKKDDLADISTGSISLDQSITPLAEPQFTTAGRKYYAIKVDYQFPDDSSLSGHPLLADSPMDPRSDTRSEMDYQTIMAMRKHHRISSVLASDTSMEFLVEGNETTPRSSGYYSSYPTSRNRHSLVRSNSLSEIISASESIRDDSSLLPGDSISVRPAQIYRAKANVAPGLIQSTSLPLTHATRHGLSIGGVRSPSASYVTSAMPSTTESAYDPSPIPPSSQVSNGTMEPNESSEMLDKLPKQKTLDDDGLDSYVTTQSIEQGRKSKRPSQHLGSVDETRRVARKVLTKPSQSNANLNSKGLPPIPPHMNNNEDDFRKARAAAVAAALSPRDKRATQESSPSSAFPTTPLNSGSLEKYAIPEDDVLSLRSGASGCRSLRKEKVRAKRQRDFEEERSRKLDEAMRLLQKDVQKKREALDREESNAAGSTGSQTPQQMPSVERLRTPPRTPPSTLPIPQFSLSAISTFVDYGPSGLRRTPSKKHHPSSSQSPDAEIDARPKTPTSQPTVFTNGPITPISSVPSSPTKTQYNNLAKQPASQAISLPPNFPPPKPTSVRSSRSKSSKSPVTVEEERELRIAALEEQKWVLEQALRVLLNQHPGTSPPGSSPILGYMDRISAKRAVSSDGK